MYRSQQFRRLFGEGALSAAFVPVFTESIEKDGLEAAGRLASKVFSMLTFVLSCILALGYIVISVWPLMFDCDAEAAALLPLMRIMLPYMLFICLVALFMGILNSVRHFFVPAVSPVLLNVIWIGAMLFVCPMFEGSSEKQIHAVAWSVLAAGVVQLLVNVPMLLKRGVKLRPDFAWRDEHVKKILLLMGPGAIGLGVFQINSLIRQFVAFAISDWAVASLQYAELMVYFPLGIFATALGTVLLPTFSRQAAKNDEDALLKTFREGFEGLLFIVTPAAVGLGVLAGPIIEAFFQHGEFGEASTIQTTRALWFFAPGLVVFSLYKILVPAFYSRKDTKTPAVVGLLAVALNFALMVLFVISWPEDYKHAGLAFASVLASTVNCIILAWIFHKRAGNPGWGSIALSAGKTLVVSAVMGGAVLGLQNCMCAATMFNGYARLVVSIMTGIIVYFSLAAIFCRKEIRHLRGK
jgi:putative peptidoglycan lipid II flippase